MKTMNQSSVIEGPAIDTIRLLMIRIGLEAELAGFRLTAKAPRCFSILPSEFKIPVKRSREGKIIAYHAFCEKFGFTPKAHIK